jgi:hypothetical protein
MLTQQQTWTVADGWQCPLTCEWGDRAQLLFVFGSPTVLQQADWQAALRQCYPNAQRFGCSTAGEIAGTAVLDDTLVVTAIAFEQTQVKGMAIPLLPNESSFAVGQRLAAALPTEDLVHVLVLSDGLQVNGSDLVRGVTAQLPAGVTLTGGLAGDGDRFGETLVLLDDQLSSGMVAAVGLYGQHLQVGYASLGGWIPFGPERRITKSSGNVLYELDGKPALALYKTYLGEHADTLPAAGLLFPLSLEPQSGQPRLVRTLLSVNEDEQSLTFAGDMPEGKMAQLMHASFDRLVDGAIDAAETCCQGLPGVQAELALLISCVGRKLLMQQRIEEEVEGVQSILGDQAMMTGFYSYGEISPFTLGAACELHNQTMTITTFTER